MNRRALLLAAAGGAVLLGGGTGRVARAQGGGRTVGDQAPELIGGESAWRNTGGKVLRLGGPDGLLKKGPVLIDFWEYTCVNCLRTLPYLSEWHKRYAPLGLTIVGIHTPEFDFAKKPENVEKAAKELGVVWPVLLDSEYRNWNSFRNNFWPRKYLLESTARITYDHAGEGGYGDTEAQIQRLLKARNPQVELPALMEPVRSSDKPGAVCYPQTREIYCGFWRGDEFFGSGPGIRRNEAAVYASPPSRLEDGKFYPAGRWKVLSESVRHERTTADPFEDFIALPYRALEVNAVIRPETGKPFDLFVLQDDKPLPKAAAGPDVRFTDDGRSYVRVEVPRMYGLVKNPKWGKHEIRLGTASDGLGLYSFTFSSCEVGPDAAATE